MGGGKRGQTVKREKSSKVILKRELLLGETRLHSSWRSSKKIWEMHIRTIPLRPDAYSLTYIPLWLRVFPWECLIPGPSRTPLHALNKAQEKAPSRGQQDGSTRSGHSAQDCPQQLGSVKVEWGRLGWDISAACLLRLIPWSGTQVWTNGAEVRCELFWREEIEWEREMCTRWDNSSQGRKSQPNMHTEPHGKDCKIY